MRILHGASTAISRIRGGERNLLDAALAAGLAVTGVVSLLLTTAPEGGRPPDAAAYLLTLAFSLPLAFRQRWPLPVLAICLFAIPVYASRGYPSALVDFLGPALAFYTVASRGPRQTSLAAAGLLALAALIAIAISPAEGSAGPSYFTSSIVIAGIWLLGDSARQKREYALQLEQQARELVAARDELAEHAVLQERLRIARDLHDVVAHHMTSVVVQAELARSTAESHPAAAARASETIASLGRDALSEMRQLLGVLRQPGNTNTELAPAPGIAELQQLYARIREGGLPIREVFEGPAVPLTPAAELAIYRVVQEALTNVVKHAPGAPTQVRLTFGPAAVEVEVRNQRPSRPSTADAVAGAGQGLKGMRERLAALGGDLKAGPCPDGGFSVAARVPIERMA